MTIERYYVALDLVGQPIAQRTTLRSGVYQSADTTGSFSVKARSTSRPLEVVQVRRAIEWIARATLIDGTKVAQRSRSYRPGRNYLLYTYTIRGTNERREHVMWTNDTAESAVEWVKSQKYHFVIFVEGTLEIRHWPTPGNSVVV